MNAAFTGALSLRVRWNDVLKPSQPIVGSSAMMCNSQYLSCARHFTEEHGIGESLHMDTPHIGFLLDRISTRRLAYQFHSALKFGEVGSAEARTSGFEIRNGLQVFCFRSWVKYVAHRNRACALRRTSSADMG